MSTMQLSRIWRVLFTCQVLAYLYGGLSLTTAQAAGGSWITSGAMTAARSSHTATILATGQVLATGGYDGSAALASAELYNPTTGAWSSTGALATALYYHTATLLASGKILVAGGYNDTDGAQATASIYDPTTRTWSDTGPLLEARYAHTATLLIDGRVLVTGGIAYDNSTLTSAEIFNPTTGTWSSAGDLAAARYAHTATLLANGTVLVAGGRDSSNLLTSAEVYDPSTNLWSDTGELTTPRYAAAAVLLLNGKVLVTGGYNDNDGSLTGAELYDPAAGTWSNAAAMATATYSHTATLLADGTVLVAGGYDDSNSSQASASVYNPSNDTWSSAGAMATARALHTAALLTTGRVLIAGGVNNDVTLASTTLYLPSLVPTTTKLTSSLNPSLVGQTVTLTAQVTAAVPAIPTGTVTCKIDGTSVLIGSLTNGSIVCFSANTLAVGSHSVTAAYAGNKVFAASTAAMTQTVKSGADFVITNLTLTPATPVAGAAVTVTVTIKNQGGSSGTGGRLSLWLDKPTVPSCGATSDKTATVGTLAAGASTTVSISATAAATAGVKTLRVFIDSACATAETNESNNQLTVSYRVVSPPARPDFVVTGITLSSDSPTANSTFAAVVTVKNQGTMAGNAGTLTLWANQATAQTCGATGDQSATVGILNAGVSTGLIITGLPAGTAGNKTLQAFIDSACVTTEGNETNNQLTKAYTVVARPDLVVTSITLTPANPLPNTTFKAVVVVKNQGTAAGSGGFLDVWLDQPTDQDCGTEGDRWADIGTLGVGASKTFTFTGLASGSTAGAKTFRAFADSWCGTVEAVETNNQLTQTWYTVAPSCLAIKTASPSAQSGTYLIDPDGAGSVAPFQAYCDMTTDGGGYTYYPVDSGITTYSVTDDNTCKHLGMDIAYPRTQNHIAAMYAKYGAGYFAIIPVYRTTGGWQGYTGCVMRNPANYGSGCADWRVPDGGKWWLRDTTFSEPNGDYTQGCWLGVWDITNPGNIRFNDANCGYSASSYICSTNDKP